MHIVPYIQLGWNKYHIFSVPSTKCILGYIKLYYVIVSFFFCFVVVVAIHAWHGFSSLLYSCDSDMLNERIMKTEQEKTLLSLCVVCYCVLCTNPIEFSLLLHLRIFCRLLISLNIKRRVNATVLFGKEKILRKSVVKAFSMFPHNSAKDFVRPDIRSR